MSRPESKDIRARFLMAYPRTDGASFTLDVDVTLPGAGITAVYGESGSGKTTLLRCLAGLERAAGGYLSIGGQVWQDDGQFLPTHRRPLGYVFQEAQLFAHLSARENLLYALRRSVASIDGATFDQVVAVMGIESILARRPDQLSGGEGQRVAIARALLRRPRLLLMDEPLSALDVARKHDILPYLERLHSTLDIPVIYVSHSADEIARLADQVLVMRDGAVSQRGSVAEVYAALDLGDESGVVLAGRVVERSTDWHLAKIGFSGGEELWVKDGGDAVGAEVRVRILAKDVSVTLSAHTDSSILNRLPVEVVTIDGAQDTANAMVSLRSGSDSILARLTHKSVAHLELAPGKPVIAQIKSVAIVR